MGVTVWNVGSGGMELDSVLLHNGVIKLRGNATGIAFDIDHDTYMSAAVDGILDLYIEGSKDFVFSTNRFEVQPSSYIEGASAVATYFAPFMATGRPQAISGPGAITTAEYYSEVTTTGADAFTLADGTVIGQLKKIQLIVDGGVATLTPTTLVNGTTITYADAGDFAILMWIAAGWTEVELGNAADGATTPVIA